MEDGEKAREKNKERESSSSVVDPSIERPGFDLVLESSKSVNALGRNGIASDGKQLESGGRKGGRNGARANIRGIEWSHCPGGSCPVTWIDR